MKYFLLTLVVACFGQLAISQNNIKLRINHKLGDQDFAMNTQATNNLGNTFLVTRLEYYVSQISITHDGGQTTSIDDTWILVNAAEPTEVDLGNYNINEIEGITYHIGVDPDHNHEDPALYPSDHPLAPKFPSMHWGWSAGYRFLAFEGLGGADLNRTIELHGLIDANYFRKTLAFEASASGGEAIISLDADYTKIIENIEVSSGVVIHGGNSLARIALENFRDYVVTPGEPISAAQNVDANQYFKVFPNPVVNHQLNMSIQSLDLGNYHVIIKDMNGRVVNQINAFSNSTHTTDLPGVGMYFLELKQDQKTIATHQVISQ
jgi:hypothetical protein